MLWECPDYKHDSRNAFMVELRDLLGESFKSIHCCSSFVLDCELWEENFESLL